MAKLLTLLEQHLDRQPPTVVMQDMTWWEAVITLVKLQEIGLRVYLPVKVCYFMLYDIFTTYACFWMVRTKHALASAHLSP